MGVGDRGRGHAAPGGCVPTHRRAGTRDVLAIAAHWGLHGAIATGIAAGLIGWESLKRALGNRLTKETK